MFELDLIVYRGARTLVEIPVPGDMRGRNYFFTAKRDTKTTSPRRVEKVNEEITVAYANGITTFSFYLELEDTQDLAAMVYKWDLDSVNPANAADSYAIARGNFELIPDVRTPFDNTALPEDGEKYIPILASHFTTKGLVATDGNTFFNATNFGLFELDENLDFVPVGFAAAIDLFETNGNDLMPIAEPAIFDFNYELDNNGDIMPKDL